MDNPAQRQQSVAEMKRLGNIILKHGDPSARMDALLQIRAYDDPRVLQLLQRIETSDPDNAVRDLAKNLLTKKKIEAGLPLDQPIKTPKKSKPAPDKQPERAKSRADSWTCTFCTAPNNGGTQCETCGAPRSEDVSYAAELSAAQAPKRMNPSGAFLLRQENRAFLEGKRVNLHRGPGCSLVILILFILGGGIILFVSGFYRQYEQEMIDHGVQTTGLVVDHRIRHNTDEGDDYYITYEYAVDGRQYSHENMVSRGEYNRAEIGTTVNITYLSWEPTRVSLTSDVGYQISTIFQFVGIAIMTIGTVFTLLRTFFWMNQRNLERNGQLIIGEVLDAKHWEDDDGDYWLKIQYLFRTPEGKLVEKTFQKMDNSLSDVRAPKRGASVAVLYMSESQYVLL